MRLPYLSRGNHRNLWDTFYLGLRISREYLQTLYTRYSISYEFLRTPDLPSLPSLAAITLRSYPWLCTYACICSAFLALCRVSEAQTMLEGPSPLLPPYLQRNLKQLIDARQGHQAAELRKELNLRNHQ